MGTTEPPLKTCGAKRRQFTHSQRVAHLAAWKSSGLSAANYGAEHGVSVASVYAWRQAGAEPSLGPTKKSPFMPVRVSSLSPMSSSIRVTLRLDEFECTAEGQDPQVLAIWVAHLKREVLGV